MASDLFCARLCEAIYSGPAGFDHTFDGDIVAGLIRINDQTVLVFRGSATVEDWLRDLDDIPTSTLQIGRVHAGFYEGMPAFLADVGMWLTGNLVLAGHSLGAARACILAGLMAAQGHPPAELHLFGCPRPGFDTLAELVASKVPMISSYRHGDDPVPEVPYFLGLYHHVKPPTEIGTPGPVAVEDHFIRCYVNALSGGGVGGTGSTQTEKESA